MKPCPGDHFAARVEVQAVCDAPVVQRLGQVEGLAGEGAVVSVGDER